MIYGSPPDIFPWHQFVSSLILPSIILESRVGKWLLKKTFEHLQTNFGNFESDSRDNVPGLLCG